MLLVVIFNEEAQRKWDRGLFNWSMTEQWKYCATLHLYKKVYWYCLLCFWNSLLPVYLIYTWETDSSSILLFEFSIPESVHMSIRVERKTDFSVVVIPNSICLYKQKRFNIHRNGHSIWTARLLVIYAVPIQSRPWNLLQTSNLISISSIILPRRIYLLTTPSVRSIESRPRQRYLFFPLLSPSPTKTRDTTPRKPHKHYQRTSSKKNNQENNHDCPISKRFRKQRSFIMFIDSCFWERSQAVQPLGGIRIRNFGNRSERTALKDSGHCAGGYRDCCVVGVRCVGPGVGGWGDSHCTDESGACYDATTSTGYGCHFLRRSENFLGWWGVLSKKWFYWVDLCVWCLMYRIGSVVIGPTMKR